MTNRQLIPKFDPEHTFFTSDTHFGHAAIISHCQRPFATVKEMDERLIKNWNRTVGPDDTVFHLGDFCLGGTDDWLRVLDRLDGHIILILGNHDLRNLRQRVASRFERVEMQMMIEVDGQRIYLNHYPFLCYGGAYTTIWQLHGHVHRSAGVREYGSARVPKRPRLEMMLPMQYDVGVDNNEFTPVAFCRIRDLLRE